jgi:hypothetical protein
LVVHVRRLAVLGAVVVVVLGAGIWLLFLRGGDAAPTVEAGSRFGSETGSGTGGTLMDTLAPLLGARVRSERGGSDPTPPTADELARAPQGAVAGLFMVGFSGTDSSSAFLERLAARPYGAIRRRSSPPRRRAAGSTRSATSPRPRRSTSATPARAPATPRWRRAASCARSASG